MNVCHLRRRHVLALTLAAAACWIQPASAQSTNKPLAVFSLSGVDEITGDIKFVSQLANNPLAQAFVGMAQPFMQGIDPKRPWGGAVMTDGLSFQGVAFVPVSDLQQVFKSAGQLGIQPSQAGDIYNVQAGAVRVAIKESNGWAFVAQSGDEFKSLPADPLTLLDKLHEKYDIAVRIYVQNVPEQFRAMAIDGITAQMQQATQQEPGEDDTTFELRRRLMQNQINQLSAALNELDSLTFGLAVDQKTKTASFDVAATALSGSKMAKQLHAPEAATAFAGFLSPTAAVRLNVTTDSVGSPEDVEQAVASINTLKARVHREIDQAGDLPPSAKQTVKEAVAQLFDALSSTVKSGKVDGAASLSLEGKLSLIAGAAVADSAPIEDALKKLDNLAKNEPNYPGIKFDADKQGDVRFHTMAVPVPPGNEATMVFGSQLDFALGIGPKAVYLAVGQGSLAKCKAAVQQSTSAGQKVPAAQVSLSIGQIMQFASQMPTSPPPVKLIAAELAKSAGKDQVNLVLKPITNGVVYHLEIQEGILKLIGMGPALAAGGAAPPAAQLRLGN